MTWTYNPPVDGAWPDDTSHIRFLVGDRTESPQSLSDEEVAALIAEWIADNGEPVDVYAVASLVADSMATSYEAEADSVSKKVGNSSLTRSYTSRSARFRDLAARLAGKARTGSTAILSGMGISRDVRDAEPVFEMRQMDNGAQR